MTPPSPSDPSKSSVIAVRGLRMAFGGIEVVKGVDVELVGGEVHAIVGENGAGKSTVAKILAGVYQPFGGTVELEGKPISFSGPKAALELGVALIHQEPLIFPDLNVAENIFVGAQPVKRGTGIDWSAMNAKADELMKSLGSSLRANDSVGGLSVADQQMVELAVALSHAAKVVILDETTAALTPKETAELFVIIRRLKAEGVAIGFVSHHLDEVMEIADRITVLRDGEVVATLDPKATTVDEIVRHMVGREWTDFTRSRTEAPAAEPLLSVKNLTSAGIFQDVSFEVRPGEIVGLGGLVGAGRTEVLRAIFGADRISSGEVFWQGKPLKLKSPTQAIRLGIMMTPEDRQHDGLVLSSSILENATLAAIRRFSQAGWINRAEERTQGTAMLESLQAIYRSVTQPVSELSGGNQQKVVLAKALLTQPKLLLLDEPTRGVDVGAKAEIHRLIESLLTQGLAIVMASSDLTELLALSDKVIVMKEGRTTARLDRSDATPESVMLAAAGAAKRSQ